MPGYRQAMYSFAREGETVTVAVEDSGSRDLARGLP
jgi:hypothetical protein